MKNVRQKFYCLCMSLVLGSSLSMRADGKPNASDASDTGSHTYPLLNEHKWEAAEKDARQELLKCELEFGKEDFRVMTPLFDLSSALMAQEKNDEALRILNRISALCDKYDSVSLPEAQISLKLMRIGISRSRGSIYFRRGEYKEAENQFKTATAIHSKFDKTDPYFNSGYAILLREYGLLLSKTGRVAEGKRMLQEAEKLDPNIMDIDESKIR